MTDKQQLVVKVVYCPDGQQRIFRFGVTLPLNDLLPEILRRFKAPAEEGPADYDVYDANAKLDLGKSISDYKFDRGTFIYVVKKGDDPPNSRQKALKSSSGEKHSESDSGAASESKSSGYHLRRDLLKKRMEEKAREKLAEKQKLAGAPLHSEVSDFDSSRVSVSSSKSSRPATDAASEDSGKSSDANSEESGGKLTLKERIALRKADKSPSPVATDSDSAKSPSASQPESEAKADSGVSSVPSKLSLKERIALRTKTETPSASAPSAEAPSAASTSSKSLDTRTERERSMSLRERLARRRAEQPDSSGTGTTKPAPASQPVATTPAADSTPAPVAPAPTSTPSESEVPSGTPATKTAAATSSAATPAESSASLEKPRAAPAPIETTDEQTSDAASDSPNVIRPVKPMEVSIKERLQRRLQEHSEKSPESPGSASDASNNSATTMKRDTLRARLDQRLKKRSSNTSSPEPSSVSGSKTKPEPEKVTTEEEESDRSSTHAKLTIAKPEPAAPAVLPSPITKLPPPQLTVAHDEEDSGDDANDRPDAKTDGYASDEDGSDANRGLDSPVTRPRRESFRSEGTRSSGGDSPGASFADVGDDMDYAFNPDASASDASTPILRRSFASTRDHASSVGSLGGDGFAWSKADMDMAGSESGGTPSEDNMGSTAGGSSFISDPGKQRSSTFTAPTRTRADSSVDRSTFTVMSQSLVSRRKSVVYGGVIQDAFHGILDRKEDVQVKVSFVRSDYEEQIESLLFTREGEGTMKVLYAARVYIHSRDVKKEKKKGKEGVMKREERFIAVVRDWCGSYIVCTMHPPVRKKRKDIIRAYPLDHHYSIINERQRNGKCLFILSLDGERLHIECSYEKKDFLTQALNFAYTSMFQSRPKEAVFCMRIASLEFATGEQPMSIVQGYEANRAASLQSVDKVVEAMVATKPPAKSEVSDLHRRMHNSCYDECVRESYLKKLVEHLRDAQQLSPIQVQGLLEAMEMWSHRPSTSEAARALYVEIPSLLDEIKSNDKRYGTDVCNAAANLSKDFTILHGFCDKWHGRTHLHDIPFPEYFHLDKNSAAYQKQKRREASRRETFSSLRLPEGISLSTLMFCENEVIVDSRDHPPSVLLPDTENIAPRFTRDHPEFRALLDAGEQWEDELLQRHASAAHQTPGRKSIASQTTSLQPRIAHAVCALRNIVGNEVSFKILYDAPVSLNSHRSKVLIVIVIPIEPRRKSQVLARVNANSGGYKYVLSAEAEHRLYQIYGLLHMTGRVSSLASTFDGPRWVAASIRAAAQVPNQLLGPGLHLGFMYIMSDFDGFHVLVPEDHRCMIPTVRITYNMPDDEEMRWVQGIRLRAERGIPILSDEDREAYADKTEGELPFPHKFERAMQDLMQALGLQDLGCLYDIEMVPLDESGECGLITYAKVAQTPELPAALSGQFAWVSLEVFESMHFNVFAPHLYKEYRRSIMDVREQVRGYSQRIGDTFDEIARRQAPANDTKVTRVKELQDKEKRWNPMRWTMRVVTWALLGMHPVYEPFLLENVAGMDDNEQVDHIMDRVIAHQPWWHQRARAVMTQDVAKDQPVMWKEVERRLIDLEQEQLRNKQVVEVGEGVAAGSVDLRSPIPFRPQTPQQQRERHRQRILELQEQAKREKQMKLAEKIGTEDGQNEIMFDGQSAVAVDFTLDDVLHKDEEVYNPSTWDTCHFLVAEVVEKALVRAVDGEEVEEVAGSLDDLITLMECMDEMCSEVVRMQSEPDVPVTVKGHHMRLHRNLLTTFQLSPTTKRQKIKQVTFGRELTFDDNRFLYGDADTSPYGGPIRKLVRLFDEQVRRVHDLMDTTEQLGDVADIVYMLDNLERESKRPVLKKNLKAAHDQPFRYGGSMANRPSPRSKSQRKHRTEPVEVNVSIADIMKSAQHHFDMEDDRDSALTSSSSGSRASSPESISVLSQTLRGSDRKVAAALNRDLGFLKSLRHMNSVYRQSAPSSSSRFAAVSSTLDSDAEALRMDDIANDAEQTSLSAPQRSAPAVPTADGAGDAANVHSAPEDSDPVSGEMDTLSLVVTIATDDNGAPSTSAKDTNKYFSGLGRQILEMVPPGDGIAVLVSRDRSQFAVPVETLLETSGLLRERFVRAAEPYRYVHFTDVSTPVLRCIVEYMRAPDEFVYERTEHCIYPAIVRSMLKVAAHLRIPMLYIYSSFKLVHVEKLLVEQYFREVMDSFVFKECSAVEWCGMEARIPAELRADFDFLWYMRYGEDLRVFMPYNDHQREWKAVYAKSVAEHLIRKESCKLPMLERELLPWSNSLGLHVNSLNLSETPVVDDERVIIGLLACPSIRMLDVHGTQVSDLLLDRIADLCPSLHFLDLRDTAVSEEAIFVLRTMRPRLYVKRQGT